MKHATTASLVAAHSATFAIRKKALVRDIDLAFEKQSFSAVCGPNGSGKTTLLRLLSGIRNATSGSVHLNGERIEDLQRSRIARILSYLPQNTWTDFDVTVWDAVAMGRLPYRRAWSSMSTQDLASVQAALERVDVAQLTRRTLPTLSGGERQRVFLARALAQEAHLLVLDEPTSSLDVAHQLDLMELLRGLHRDGHTIIAAMHDLRLVWDYFQDCVVLDQGRVIARGPTRETLTRPEVLATFGVSLSSGESGLRIERA